MPEFIDSSIALLVFSFIAFSIPQKKDLIILPTLTIGSILLLLIQPRSSFQRFTATAS